ncbi:MAG: putative dehydrogenase [Candidatus Azotimanducaceae bacterium]|jgi:predicted dehydrogenase
MNKAPNIQCIVVGTGSIARRHIQNLRKIDASWIVACVSASGRTIIASDLGVDLVFDSLEDAVVAKPKFAIIASPASLHLEHALKFLRADIPTLIEKPLSDTLTGSARQAASELQKYKHLIDVGYNLRNAPAAIRMQTLLETKCIGRLTTVMLQVGQFLPDWRVVDDYKQSVSAKKTLGGGALLELSHELDYLLWLFGSFDTVYCIEGRSDILDIEVEDQIDAVFTSQSGLVAYVHLDFLQRVVSRNCKVIGEEGTLEWDLLTNTISVMTADKEPEFLNLGNGYDRNDMYIDELHNFVRFIEGKQKATVGLPQARSVMALIAACRDSSQSGERVSIEFPAHD